jgi:hypothetical protein
MGKRKIAEQIDLYLKIIKTILLVIALFGGGIAGIVKYYDFLVSVVGEVGAIVPTVIIISGIAILSGIILSIVLKAVRLNGKDKE